MGEECSSSLATDSMPMLMKSGRCLIPVVLALEELRQEDGHELEASWGNKLSSKPA